ncbi:MAG: RIP metalloprotease RseP [Bacteroidaceae bacterium]|nr:RIP metalloprotease RseP [Bacteroidaceae bacterium]
METFLIRALQLIMSLAFLVIIHEGGHFFFAKLFKVRVTKFYLFFDPWFSLFKWKPKNSETEYGIGWLPFGGYVQIAGMVDETQSSEDLNHPVEPWEFRAKPAWQRLFIMIGGVLVNFVAALFIYSMLMYTWGDSYVSVPDLKNGMKFSQQAQAMGFRDGDILLRTNEAPFERLDADMFRAIADASTVTVRRDGQEVDIPIPEEFGLLDMNQGSRAFVEILVPAVVDSVVPETPAALAGLQKGDKFLAFNGLSVNSYNQFTEYIAALRAKSDSITLPEKVEALRQVNFVVARSAGGQDTLTAQLTPDFKLGFTASLGYERTNLTYSFLESFPAGISYGVNVLKGYVGDLKYVFTKEGANSLGGFGTIGSIFPATWDWHRFWEMTAFLSIILAFMNILPIPALDGGHVLFLFYEIITRRKPSEKFMERAQVIGMALLFGLMIWANFNDVIRFLF